MTQEELDALMAGDLDDVQEDAHDEPKIEESALEEEEAEDDILAEDSLEEEPTHEEKTQKMMDEYRASSTMSWPPPPPTDDHKMVHQLDDVTKDSEIKAGQVFDKLETVNAFMMSAEENAKDVIKLIEGNISLFQTLVAKFPKIEQFQVALDENKSMKDKVEDLLMNAQMAEDEIMMTMDIMQYQDIHRQKSRELSMLCALFPNT